MLLDLWRLADRRSRPPKQRPALRGDGSVVDELTRGIAHHLEVDRWFHATKVFSDGQRETAKALSEAAPEVPKLSLFAHVTWEMCLDGVWLLAEGLEPTVAALRRDIDEVGSKPLEQVAGLHALAAKWDGGEIGAFHRRMGWLLEQLVAGRWLASYQHGAGLCERLATIRWRLGLPSMDEPQRAAIALVLEQRLGHASEALRDLMAERERFIDHADF